MKIKEKYIKTIIILSAILCVSITPIIFSEEVSAANTFEYQVLDLVNQERAKVGAAPLKMDKELYDAAQIRSKELQTKFSHTRPDGSPWYTVSPKASGENIAYGPLTPQAVMNGWMNSPGHKANILNPSFKSIGIGYYKGSTSFWVQLFGYGEANERLESGSTTPTTPTTPTIPTIPTKPITPTTPTTPTTPDLQKSVKPGTPVFSLESGSKKIIIKWKQVSKASGYEIYKSTKKNGEYTLLKTIKKGNILQYTNKNLKKNTKYFYKMRAYTFNNAKKVYSKISSSKTKTTKK